MVNLEYCKDLTRSNFTNRQKNADKATGTQLFLTREKTLQKNMTR